MSPARRGLMRRAAFCRTPARRRDDVEHAVTDARAEVIGVHARLTQRVDGGDVALREVNDVDIVAHARSVGGGIVVPEHADLRQLADRHFGDVRGEVVGDALRILADQPARVRAHGVEVAQQGDRPAGVGDIQVAQDLFLHIFGGAVRVGRAARAAVFVQRELFGRAVDGRGRGEDELFDAELLHRFEQHEGGAEVVVVVLERLFDALPHRLEPRKVDDPVDGVFAEHLFESGGVAHVLLVEAHRFAGDLPDALDRLGGRVAQVVDDDHAVARLQQFDAGMRADVARPARH